MSFSSSRELNWKRERTKLSGVLKWLKVLDNIVRFLSKQEVDQCATWCSELVNLTWQMNSSRSLTLPCFVGFDTHEQDSGMSHWWGDFDLGHCVPVYTLCCYCQKHYWFIAHSRFYSVLTVSLCEQHFKENVWIHQKHVSVSVYTMRLDTHFYSLNISC